MTNQNSKIEPDSNPLKITRRRWRPRFILLYLGFILLGFVVFLVLGEGLIRLAVPEQYWRLYVAQDDWLPDPVMGWRNKPNLNVTRRFESDMVRFVTNTDGLQVARSLSESGSEVYRVMLFGDSTVVGRAVAEDARLHHQLARRLASRGIRAEVINAGVEGYSTDQSLLAMEALVPRYHPQVVIHMICANDFFGNGRAINYGLPKPYFTLSNLGRLDLAPPRLEISPLTNETPVIFARSTLQKSAFYRMLQPALSRFRARGGRATQNLAQGDDMSPTPDLLSKADWSLFGKLVVQMRAACTASGATLLLTQHPSIGEIENSAQLNFPLEAQLIESANSCGVSFCPVILKLRQSSSHNGPFHLLPRDPHCNGRGYEQIAACLDEYIAARLSMESSDSNNRNSK